MVSAKKLKVRRLARFEANHRIDFTSLIRDALKRADIAWPFAADGGDDQDPACAEPPGRACCMWHSQMQQTAAR